MQKNALPLRPALCLLFLIGTAFSAVEVRAGSIIITAKTANVREKPNPSAEIIASVEKGEIVDTSASWGKWAYITAGEIRGWVHNSTYRPTVEKDFAAIDAYIANSLKEMAVHANNRTRIYHLPGCPNYDDITLRNIVYFKTREEAEKAGYRRARNCPRK